MRHVVYNINGTAMILCWGVVGIVWALGAVMASRRAPVGQREGRDLASLAGILFGLIAVTTPASLWHPLNVESPFLRLVGLLLLLPATAAAVWARLALGTMWASAAVTKREHALHASGPYRLTRHPIYTSILAMVAATALSQGIGRWAAIFVGVTTVLLLKIRTEERLLGREFPDEYPRYQQEVPGLIPLPYRSRARQP
jgi:protein-S-isoprenylcysteine O-methyltransferase Ste14